MLVVPGDFVMLCVFPYEVLIFFPTGNRYNEIPRFVFFFPVNECGPIVIQYAKPAPEALRDCLSLTISEMP